MASHTLVVAQETAEKPRSIPAGLGVDWIVQVAVEAYDVLPVLRRAPTRPTATIPTKRFMDRPPRNLPLAAKSTRPESSGPDGTVPWPRRLAPGRNPGRRCRERRSPPSRTL